MIYEAPGLKEVNASLIIAGLKRIGPLVFVGDSLSRQMYRNFDCFLQKEVGPGFNVTQAGLAYYALTLFGGTLAENVEEFFELRLEPKQRLFYEDTQWVDEAIRLNASYIVVNAGAWWHDNKFYRRGNWCEYANWTKPTEREFLQI